jgi:hypothetical protein
MVRAEMDMAAPELREITDRLAKLTAEAEAATAWLASKVKVGPEDAAAGAYHYMELIGFLALGWLWLRMASAAHRRIASGDASQFNNAKLATARFYFERLVPEAMTLRERMEAGATSVMALEPALY